MWTIAKIKYTRCLSIFAKIKILALVRVSAEIVTYYFGLNIFFEKFYFVEVPNRKDAQH